MTIAERNEKLKHFITCLKCEVNGKCCDDSCPTQYEAGNMGEIIENLEAISKALEVIDKYKPRENNVADIEALVVEAANIRDLTFAKDYNGRAYALMDVDWIGYFDTLDEVIKYLGISEEIMTKDMAVDAIKDAFQNSEYTDELIKTLEQEPLNKLKAEIKEKIEQEEFARSVFRHEEKEAYKAEQCTGSIFAYKNVIKLIDNYIIK